jgi:hypothetical protein
MPELKEKILLVSSESFTLLLLPVKVTLDFPFCFVDFYSKSL